MLRRTVIEVSRGGGGGGIGSQTPSAAGVVQMCGRGAKKAVSSHHQRASPASDETKDLEFQHYFGPF